MSAYIVETSTIQTIVMALVDRGIVDPKDGTTIGRALFTENVRSVNYRYRGTSKARAPRFHFDAELAAHRSSKRPNPSIALGALECFGYQACEHPSWEASLVCALTRTLRALLVTEGATRESPAYAWG